MQTGGSLSTPCFDVIDTSYIGAVIVAARQEGYCDTANFTTALNACLDCAFELDIWQLYGDSVSAAATVCGLDAMPVPANSTSATNTTTSVPVSSSTSEMSIASQSAGPGTSMFIPTSAIVTPTATASETSMVSA